MPPPSRRYRRRSDWANSLPNVSAKGMPSNNAHKKQKQQWSSDDIHLVSDAASTCSSSSPSISFDNMYLDQHHHINSASSSSSASSTSSLSPRPRPSRHRYYHHYNHHQQQQQQQRIPTSLSSSSSSSLLTPPPPPSPSPHPPLATTPSASTPAVAAAGNSTRCLKPRRSVYQQQINMQQAQERKAIDMRSVSFSDYTAAELPDLAFLFRSFFPSKPKPSEPTTTQEQEPSHRERCSIRNSRFVSAPVLHVADLIDQPSSHHRSHRSNSRSSRYRHPSHSQSQLVIPTSPVAPQSPSRRRIKSNVAKHQQQETNEEEKQAVKSSVPIDANAEEEEEEQVELDCSNVSSSSSNSSLSLNTSMGIGMVSSDECNSLLIVRLECFVDSTFQVTRSLVEKLLANR